MELGTVEYLYVGMAALVVGFSKTSVGGVGILATLFMALAIPGKASPGVLLPMLIAADIMAVLYYRRACQWGILIRLLPAAAVGVFMGYLVMRALPDLHYSRIIGWVILSLLVFDLGVSQAIKSHAKNIVATGFVGMLAGATSMVANAAGPIFGIYLLQMGLNKHQFVGTRSWYFLVMNLVKLPFAVGLGIVTGDSLTLNLWFLPVIFIGAILGRLFLNVINVHAFQTLIRLAALIAAARLILY